MVDAGANVGIFLLWLESIGFQFDVHSFEPVPDTYQALISNCRNVKVNSFVSNEGLGKSNGQITVYHHPRLTQASGSFQWSKKKENVNLQHTMDAVQRHWIGRYLPSVIQGWLSRRILKWHRKSVPIKCDVVRWSDYANKYGVKSVDLFKIDVEGAELDVLQGIDDNHWPGIKQFVIEAHGDWMSHCVQLELVKRGYTVTVDESADLPMIYAKR